MNLSVSHSSWNVSDTQERKQSWMTRFFKKIPFWRTLLQSSKWQSTIRFLEPSLGKNKWYAVRVFSRGAAVWLYAVAGVRMVEYITQALLQNDFLEVKPLLFIYLGVFVLYVIFYRIFFAWQWPDSQSAFVGYLQAYYIRRLLLAENTAVDKIGTGKLLWVFQWVFTLWADLISNLWEILWEQTIIFGFAIYLMLFSYENYWRIALLGVMLVGIWIYFTNKRTLSYRSSRKELKIEWSRTLARIVMSKFEILRENRISKELKVFEQWNERNRISEMGISKPVHDMFFGPYLLFFCVRFGFYSLIAFWLMDQGSISKTVGFVTLIALIERMANYMAEYQKDFTKNLNDVYRLWSTFDEIPEMKGYEEGRTFKYSTGVIELENVFYSYGDAPVIAGLSLKLQGGKKTAFVGMSWGGKTTIMKLIAGYIHPDSGNISVDSQELGSTALKTYFPHIGYLTQDPSVFDGTIRENLMFGIRDGSAKYKKTEDLEEQIKKALHDAECDFVFELAKWVDTEIGERGIRLSGGQRQRLAIAKIFMKNPEIILLDEPTSALDSFSEEKIAKAFDRLFEWRTVVVIAHRLQTVRKADEILVIENGAILERGSHTQLIQNGGNYARMLELQSGF